MLSGSEVVYTPVEANGVSFQAARIISGGSGGDATITSSMRFFWFYNPDTKQGGFTGVRWYEDMVGSPIYNYLRDNSKQLSEFLDEFVDAVPRQNLNDIFSAWNDFVKNNSEGKYQDKFYGAVWNANGDCATTQDV